MTQYQFAKSIAVDVPCFEELSNGKKVPGVRKRIFSAGEVITAAEILPGCLEACLRTRAIVQLEDAVPPAPEVQAPALSDRDPLEHRGKRK